MLADRIPSIQISLAEDGLDGWLLACFQNNDPVSRELLGLAEGQLVSRRSVEVTGGEPQRELLKLI